MRWPVSSLSPIPFLAGRLHGVGQREGASEGEVQVEGILTDIDNDFLRPKALPEFSARRHGLRPRFRPY